MFKELKDDPFYKEYRNYGRCVLDYGLLESQSYEGLKTHKEAVLFFIKAIWKDNIDYSKMKAQLINYKDFFKLPNNYERERHCLNNNDYHRPYWFLFLNPPYGTNYTLDDFIKINNVLFPKGKDNLEIYEWSVDWSSYFIDGLEWWGAMCTSIYDKSLNRFVVILASATD